MGEIQTDTRIRVHGGGELPGAVRLPQLEDVEPRREPVLDHLGRLVAERPALLGAGLLAGAFAGAVFGGGGAAARSLRGIGGALAGLAGAGAIGSVAARVSGSSDPTTDNFVARGGSATPPRPKTEGPEQLRVLDWNVHALRGRREGPRSSDEALAAIASVVQRERPDVLVLQEVQVDQLLGGGNDDLADLAEALGATDAVLVPNGTRPNGTQKGQAVLTFGAARIQDARGLTHVDPLGDGPKRQLIGALGWARSAGVPLPYVGPPFHPRTTADVMLTTAGGRAVRLLNVHLSGTGGTATGGTPGSTERQRQQLLPLLETLDAWDGPTLLAGDFNVRSGSHTGEFEVRHMTEAGMRDAFTEVGIPLDHGRKRGTFQSGVDIAIDRVYASEEITVRDARVARDETARSASDHLPIIADLELA